MGIPYLFYPASMAPLPHLNSKSDRLRLSAAIEEAEGKVLDARSRLALADGVNQSAARSLDTWSAILDSRVARLKSIDYRDGSSTV